MREKVISWSGAFLLVCCVGFWTVVMVWRGDVPLLGPSVIHAQPSVAQNLEEVPEDADSEVAEEGEPPKEDIDADVAVLDEGVIEDAEVEQPADAEVASEEPHMSEAVYTPPQWKFKELGGKVSKTEVSLNARGIEVAVGTYDGWCEEISSEELRTLGDAETAAYCQSLKGRVIFVMSIVDGTLSLHMLRSNSEEPELIHQW